LIAPLLAPSISSSTMQLGLASLSTPCIWVALTTRSLRAAGDRSSLHTRKMRQLHASKHSPERAQYLALISIGV
jgi:hypothetical protein